MKIKSVLTDTFLEGTSKEYDVPVPPSNVGIFFQDNFASGDKSKRQNGFKWENGNSVVSNDISFSGSNSLKFKYEGKSPKNGGNNEQNFYLGSEYNELYIRYMIYLPKGNESWGGAKYSRFRGTGSSKNHKLFRIWGNHPNESGHDGYNSGGHNIGSSTWPQGSAGAQCRISFELFDTDGGINNSGGSGMVKYQDTIFNDNDLGKWTEIQFGTKAATSPTNTDAFARMWKNGNLIGEYKDFNNWIDNDRPKAIRTNGYLLGPANGGFETLTYVFIDDIYFSTSFII